MWSKTLVCSFINLLAILSMPSYLTNAESHCSNPPPGVAKMFGGLDITTLDLLPLDITGNQGIKSRVIAFTCNDGKSWTSPSSGDKYQLPDQVAGLTSTPGGWMSAKVELFKYSNDVRNWLNINVGVQGAYKGFSFSSSQSYKKMQHTITNTERYVEDVTAFESATRAELVTPWVLKLDGYAQDYVEQHLNGTFESNRGVYEIFIREYGTHYFSKANFGGLIRKYMETNKDYVYSKSDQEIKVDAKASYLSFISLNGGTVSGSTKVTESFSQATSSDTKYYGGTANLLEKNGLQQWQSTVDDDPWLFSGDLRPISDLIRDSTKKENLIKAVNEHVMRSYLEELQRMVTNAKVTDEYLTTLEGKISNMQSTTTLVKEQVEALGNDVEHNLVVPLWFWENTELCFKWRSVGDRGQCGGNDDVGQLCSKPNSRTASYLDDTDDRDGSCRMQWGITSQNNPPWFNNVQICYRWLQYGGGKQCGGKLSGVFCAGINLFTNEYRDDTDGRGGGCFMSWKLEVPLDAPVWIRTASLCFYWYPDHNNNQCGLGTQKKLCAVAGDWTTHYRDDTDDRPGGCRMSWELKVNTVDVKSKEHSHLSSSTRQSEIHIFSFFSVFLSLGVWFLHDS